MKTTITSDCEGLYVSFEPRADQDKLVIIVDYDILSTPSAVEETKKALNILRQVITGGSNHSLRIVCGHDFAAATAIAFLVGKYTEIVWQNENFDDGLVVYSSNKDELGKPGCL